MSSATRIDGSLPAAGPSPDTGLVFSGGWAVEYNWVADRASATGQPTRLLAHKLPASFDSNLEGALRGQAAFSEFLYLFKDGQYLKLRQDTMTPVAPPASTAGPWDLPADWTSFDAVFPGAGIKKDFAYFFRGDEYCRFDWRTDKRSPNYPKKIDREWHTAPPFDRDLDGVIIGQGSFNTKAYLFKTITAVVDRDGNQVPAGTPGSFTLSLPAYARYDFNMEKTEFTVTDPAQVIRAWKGLFPLLDAGPAVDTGLVWCNAAIASLAAGLSTSALSAALSHHFMNSSPTPDQMSAIQTRMTRVRDRLTQIPDRFVWTPGLASPAQTAPDTLTEIGDNFSIFGGPNGRPAAMIHEAVHFTFTRGGIIIDVPEWSGETVNGVPFGVDTVSNIVYHTITTDEAIENPSSYAAFAQEVRFLADTRFGDARRHE